MKAGGTDEMYRKLGNTKKTCSWQFQMLQNKCQTTNQ